ncbi:DUF4442 domain-containing protein [Alginatibacterium sediminis]|uniref:DUF4442 domain-containing protein n=1 Tax=Alginatibacterium sediminis TaxID=2164068 RepID=A0A420EB12_9ALTE|nr:DUF4442 domain-containing protein [Alginatibacterium sediminis]RKF17844.1 DUF4442 domain-containing protein [Alginatibacterium sediminis]
MQTLLLKANSARRLLNLWPPFWGAGIQIKSLSQDFLTCRVELSFRWWNKNANRSQFGGSMFAMTDPIYPLMMMGLLGPKYLVCDSSASVEFKKPGMGRLSADFQLDHETVDAIRSELELGEKYVHNFEIDVRDETGLVVATVSRQVYMRLKRKYRTPVIEQQAA